jgi:hypothetical protein
LTKRINIHNTDESGDDISDYFPQLVWVLRDFSLDKGNTTQKEYLELCLKSVDSDNEGLAGKNACRDIIKRHFKKRDCYMLVIPTTDEQKIKNLETESKSALRPEFLKQVDDMIALIKSTISEKKINNISLDGEALFSLLQSKIAINFLDYIESLNNGENPVILSALENVLLSKAKNMSEKFYEIYEKDINNKFEGKYPLDIMEIYKEYFDVEDSILPQFCDSVNDILTTKQAGNYILKLFARMRDELENILENNKSYYDEWYDQEYDEFTKGLSNTELAKLEDTKVYLNNFVTELQNGLIKFLDIPNSEFCKNLINIILKILNDNIFDRLRKLGAGITELHVNSIKDITNQVETLNSQIRRLQEALNQEKKINEEKNKEKSELYVSKIELESKYEKLTREFKSKEREYTNNLNVEGQRYQKLESYYANIINEKDKQMSQQEQKIEKLTKEINDINKDHSNKIIELNKENTKLHVELERIKGQEKKGKNDVYDSKNVNLQSLFKTIQNIFMEFKDSVDKLDREKENVFKTKYLELSTKEIEGKSRNWIEEIRIFREDQIRAISENYEKTISKLRDDSEESNFALTKANYSLNEEVQLKETYKSKWEDCKRELQEYINISNYKDSIINTQKEVRMVC